MSKARNNVMHFLKRNGLYIVLALCIIAVGLSITLILTNNGEENVAKVDDGKIVQPVEDEGGNEEPTVDPTEGDDSPVVVTETYILPVANSTSITDYSTSMVFNSTLKRFSSHQAVDFFADEGTNVCAIADGVVESVETTLIYGTTVVIDHGNGLKSIYNSLEDGDMVVSGQTVKQGDVIGCVSVSNRQEYKEGAHLHFQMKENEQIIDPAKYLTFEQK